MSCTVAFITGVLTECSIVTGRQHDSIVFYAEPCISCLSVCHTLALSQNDTKGGIAKDDFIQKHIDKIIIVYDGG